MNIKKAKDEIKNTVRAYLKKDADGEYVIPSIRQRPILLIGPPGVGKTQIMEQIAKECRIGLVSYTITHHTRQSAVGLPFIVKEEFGGKEYSVTEYTMSEIIASVHRKIKESGISEGILFIDEINCVSETLAPTMLQFLQCKTFGNQEVPKGWIIVAAGNPSEYNKSVREFDMVTLDRVRKIDIEADFNIWKEYAANNHINRAIINYLELRPNNFYKVEADIDGMQFVTARGWEDLSNLYDVYNDIGIKVDEDIIAEFIQHDDTAKDVAAYFALYEKYKNDYGIQEILAGNPSKQAYKNIFDASFDERVSVINLLISGLEVSFHRVWLNKFVTDIWYDFLKDYKSRLKEDTSSVFNTLVEEKKCSFEMDKKAGFLNKDEIKANEYLISKLSETQMGQEKDIDAAFEKALSGFESQRKTLEESEDIASEQLENAFSFIEETLGAGQEMVVFVTELTLNSETAMFLADNPSEKYLKYNSELLIGTKKEEILSKLRKDEIYGSEHIRDL
ncbi:AAA family ATPase [Eubacterium sp. MSJ-13]|uniref:AAA family ATPase n=1 Tax=Eubacterium sp. MSJ-13 TaxID=2841513 RepID=UPI001C11A37E|nr:AAA family ATPase [Eubacterium sp. MSJ-13]MBU5479192.1 AAA family ATPase [Eubacterium sp. MSJ-13]